MFIYKITNLKNNKVYIGQTIRPIEQIFESIRLLQNGLKSNKENIINNLKFTILD